VIAAFVLQNQSSTSPARKQGEWPLRVGRADVELIVRIVDWVDSQPRFAQSLEHSISIVFSIDFARPMISGLPQLLRSSDGNPRIPWSERIEEWHMDERYSARGQHTPYFSHRGAIIFHVLHNVEADDEIKTAVPKRKDLKVTLDLPR
jgi:hypothetical protein